MDTSIQDLQLRLLHMGYDIGQSQADGIMGPATKTALKVFQSDYGILPDGDYGPLTQKMVELKCIAGPNEPSTVSHLTRFRVTTYLSSNELDYGHSNKIIPVRDDRSNLLAMVDPVFFCNLSLEGTGKLADGRVLNVTGNYISAPNVVQTRLIPVAKSMFKDHYQYGGMNSDGSKYFAFKVLGAEYPWGIGVGGRPLKLWRSLAADIGTGPRSDPQYKGRGGLVSVGTRVYILELDGMVMPDGWTHDGWCEVDDTGSAIYGAHFDWFVGSNTYMKQILHRNTMHIWFEGCEESIGLNYNYGLTK